MKRQLLAIVGVTTLTSVVTLAVSVSPVFSQANSSNSQSDKVTFLCKEIFDSASGEKIPATIVWIPERQGHVRFIGWKSQYFEKNGWTPQERCQKVTEKFQQLYSQGRLNYLSYGTYNGYPIICGLANQGETCNGDNQLFTIKLGSTPEQVLQRLMDIAEGKASDILLQSSGKQMYIAVQPFLNKAPTISKGN